MAVVLLQITWVDSRSLIMIAIKTNRESERVTFNSLHFSVQNLVYHHQTIYTLHHFSFHHFSYTVTVFVNFGAL